MSFEFVMEDVFRFVPILARVSAMLVVLPVFGSRTLPRQFKVFLAIAISALVYPSLQDTTSVAVRPDLSIVPLLFREVLIGFLLGMVGSLIFRGVEFAGEVVGMQMGLSIANVIDPSSGGRISVISQFQKIILILLFFSINGHFIFIRAIQSSYELAPIAVSGVNPLAAYRVVELAGKVFLIALQLAAPATIMLLLTHLVLAVVSRSVPQMNVFIVGFPLTIGVGLFILAASLPAFVQIVKTLFGGLPEDLTLVIRAL